MFVESVRAVVDNAVKYSDKGSAITIRLSSEENNAVIAVEDKGCGISKEDLPRVFDRFYRCDKARRRDNAESSCGLGLTIAASVVQTMGGTISVESEEGVGSTFIFRFPLKGEESDE
jgi:signal transduction histidine kinase